MNICALTVLLAFIVAAAPASKAPVPYCYSKPIYGQFPLTVEEILSADMSYFFSGYNLNISIISNNSFEAKVARKWQILDRRNSYFPNIISHYIEPKHNTVGRDSFLLYKDLLGTVFLSYGVIRNRDELPDVTSTTPVTSDKSVTCFDAVLFLEHGLAIVDCMKDLGSQRFQNQFYVIDLASYSIKKVFNNDLFVGFTKITRRKLMRYEHPEAVGYYYMIRTYFYDGVDEAHSDNTYFEVFAVPVEDPSALEIIGVVDRSFLSLKKLKISDVQIYLDDIFILDYDTGLFRLDILPSQRIQITGRYRDFGFEKFSVYSDDLENELIIALSNKHAVYEIDWHIVSQPVLISKYSLMSGSKVKQILLNDIYVIVQGSALGFNDTHKDFQIDYTWIFTKGSRTYMNAYHIIEHNSSIVEIEFDRSLSRLYIADEKGLSLRQIAPAQLVLHFIEEGKIGTKEEVVIVADSYDMHSNQSIRCQEKFTVWFVSKENMTAFPTGLDPVDSYSLNYPGVFQVYLDDYHIGPNLTYEALDSNAKALPNSWVNKVNQTKITIDKPPKVGDINFFHTDVIPELGSEVVIYYYQDIQNVTHFAECIHLWGEGEMRCIVGNSFQHTSRVRNFCTAYFRDQSGWFYYYIIGWALEPKVLKLFDFVKGEQIATITNQGDHEAEIQSISSSNGYLYVLRRAAKTIDVYELKQCQQNRACKIAFKIDRAVMKNLGISYFAPESIVTDLQHPEVLFIRCLGSLIILDVDNKMQLTLLDEIVSPVTQDRHFRVAVNKYRLLLVSPPNLVYEYSLQNIYRYNRVTLTKVLPTYGMTIQPQADIEFSDFQNTVYINAMDPKLNVSVVMIYRTGYAAANSFYSLIYLDQLYSRTQFEIEVSGYFMDFVSIIAGGKFLLYRVFQYPSLSIVEQATDFSFKIHAKNPTTDMTTKQLNVTIVNTNQNISATPFFNQSRSTLKAEKQGNYQWDDRKWFTGNVVHHNYTCDECHKGADSKVKLREHIDDLHDLHVGGYFYTESPRGGLSVWNDLFRWRINGSVYEVVNLPDQKLLETCQRVVSSRDGVYAITACQELGAGINLYVTSMASFKSFTWGPYRSAAYNVRNLQSVNDLLMLVDTPANPQFFFETGEVYIYRVSFNHETQQQMNELQVFDSNDFMGCHGWTEDEAYLGNAHLLYSANTQAYRLYMTQVRYGLFVVEFTKAGDSDEQLTILSTSFINLKQLLLTNNLHMPSDAIFLGVKFVKSSYHPLFETENIVVTTRGYHNFQITIVYDDKGKVLSSILHRVLFRYGFYSAVNEVQAENGFILLGYTVPANVVVPEHYRKQYVAIYDSLDYPHEFDKGYSQRFIVGALAFNTSSPVFYALNTTYDARTNGSRTGLVFSLRTTARLIGATVSHNLSLDLSAGYKNQDLKIVAYNDFSMYEFTTSIVQGSDQSSSSTIIIIIIVLCSIVVVFFGFYIFSVAKKKPKSDQRESLLTENETITRDSVAPPVEFLRRQSVDDDSNQEEEVEEVHRASENTTLRSQVTEVPVNKEREVREDEGRKESKPEAEKQVHEEGAKQVHEEEGEKLAKVDGEQEE